MQINVSGQQVTVCPHPVFTAYATSGDGRVFTRPALPAKGSSSYGPRPRAKTWKEVSQFVVQPRYTPPYKRCRVTQGGKTKLVLVHRFMLECWVGIRPRGIVTRHLDGHSLHNELANLCYGTVQENVNDTFKHTGNYAAGENNGHARLTASDVKVIRERYDHGERAADIARSYKFVSYNTVLCAAIRKTWKSVV